MQIIAHLKITVSVPFPAGTAVPVSVPVPVPVSTSVDVKCARHRLLNGNPIAVNNYEIRKRDDTLASIFVLMYQSHAFKSSARRMGCQEVAQRVHDRGLHSTD